jgi:hypothetical protein
MQLFFAFFFGILTLMLQGVVFQDMWGWFIVPLGVMALSWEHALGLWFFIRWCGHSRTTHDDEDENAPLKNVAAALGVTLVIWGLGWAFSPLV